MTQPVPFQPQPSQQWQPPVGQGQRPRANAQGIDIAAFILVWFFPPIALILGHVGRSQAKRAGYQPCSLSTWAVVLGWMFVAFWVAVIVFLIVAGVIGAANSTGTY